MNGRNSATQRIVILFIVLIACSACTTGTNLEPDLDEDPATLVPPIPIRPTEEPVRFEERDGGLWLSYADYRALERNIITLREYVAKLESVVQFYTE